MFVKISDVLEGIIVTDLFWIYRLVDDEGKVSYVGNDSDPALTDRSFLNLRDVVDYIIELRHGCLDAEVAIASDDGSPVRYESLEHLYDYFSHWSGSRRDMSPLAQASMPKKTTFRPGEDPQRERAILMRLHRLSWEDAIKRWPLEDYARWRRSGL